MANPLAMILSMGMMFRYTFERADIAARIEKAVRGALAKGLRTADIAAPGTAAVGTQEMGAGVAAAPLQPGEGEHGPDRNHRRARGGGGQSHGAPSRRGG